MKIGIVTHWNSLDNYGQQLQCFALQTVLRSWGHDAFLIRYAPKSKQLTVWQRIIAHIKHPKYFLHHLPVDSMRKRSVLYEKELVKVNLLNNPKRKFEEFRREHLKMTDLIYSSYAALYANPPEADLYIVGSDQVWRMSHYNDSIPGWFLKFGDVRVRRISYAASMGEGVKREMWPALRNYLSCLDAISVREESAARLCHELGFKAEVTLDPTMLLTADFYLKMATRENNGKQYAFLYLLNVKSVEEFHWQRIKKYIDSRGLQLKSVSGSGYYQGRELIEGNRNLWATIPEWIGLIGGAKCVFTTSYHGTIFAILTHRPFLVIGLQGKYRNANCRIEQLLAALGIAERQFNPSVSVAQQMDSTIDWEQVDLRIEELRRQSVKFLKANIISNKA